MRTVTFLRVIMKVHGFHSAYALHKYMSAKYGRWTKGAVNNYFRGKQLPDDSVALDIAHELDLDEGYVLACIHAERSKTPSVKKAWERTAQALRAILLPVILSALLSSGFAIQNKALAQDSQFNILSLMRSCRWAC